MHNLLATYSPDLTLITDATEAITAIVAAAILCYVAKFGFPVARTVYAMAKRILSGA
jgi:hypothetical protein